MRRLIESMIGAARHDVAVEALAPQIEEAVAQADVLGILDIAEDGQRQFLRFRQNFDLAGEDLDEAGRQIAVLGAGRPWRAPCRRRGSPIRRAAFRRS